MAMKVGYSRTFIFNQTGERHKLNGEGYEGTPTVNLKNSLKKSVTIELDQFEKPLHFGG